MPDLFESLDLDKIKSNLNWDQIPIETLIELSSTDLIKDDILQCCELDLKNDVNLNDGFDVGDKRLVDHLEGFANRINAQTLIDDDHHKVLYPDYRTPFNSLCDVFDRLIPYHVFEHNDHDLDLDVEPITDEVALDFHRRRLNLYKRVGKARQYDLETALLSNLCLKQVNSVMKEDNNSISLQLKDLKSKVNKQHPKVATSSNSSSNSNNNNNNNNNNTQIPLTLPTSRLTQLIGLGIIPVPRNNVDPNQRLPACVLNSVSADQSTVGVVVNFGSLESRQLATLATLLRSWVDDNNRNNQSNNNQSNNNNSNR